LSIDGVWSIFNFLVLRAEIGFDINLNFYQ
jgi:hypothetical protein